MAKIGRIRVEILLVTVFALFVCFNVHGYRAQAQNVEVNTTLSQNEVFTGERISVTVEISGSGFNNVSRPTIPEIPGELEILNRTPSTSQSFSFVNGKSSIKYGYTYYFVARESGSFTIPAFSVKVDGTSYKANPLTLKVFDRNKAKADNSDNSNNTPAGTNEPDIYLTFDVSDTTPYNGQQILADVMLYFKSGLEVLSYQPAMGWKAEGFWKEQLESNERPKAYSTIIDGVRYRKARLAQFALFPSKTGDLELSPYKITANVRSASNRNDAFSSFFGGFNSNNRRVELETEVVKIDVRELPEIADAKPIGAVGNFEISRNVSSSNVFEGETIEINTTIQGTGNVPLISAPEYDLPDNLEIYQPKDQSDVNRNGKQIAGKRTFTNVVIARKPGTYTIPSAKIAYFDPGRGSYDITNLAEITVNVKVDPNGRTLVSADQTAFTIQPVLGLASWTTGGGGSQNLSTYWWFWMGLITPFVLLAIGYWQKSYRDRMNSDVFFARAQNATDKAKAAMDKAYEEAEDGDIKEAYGALHKALTGYVGDRLGLPEAGLSDKQYIEKLNDNGMDQDITKQLFTILDKCSSIRYAPLTTRQDLADDIEQAKQLLSKLKRKV